MIRKIRIKYLERMAFNAFALSRFEVASQNFEAILKLDPVRKGIRLNLGLALVSMNLFAEALDRFQEERTLHGKSLPLCKAMAEAAYRMGDRDMARCYYEQVSCLNPSVKEKNFFVKRIKICADENMFNNAIKAQQIMDKGGRLMLQKNFDQAESLFEEAYRLDNTTFQALNNIGAIRTSKKDYPAAKSYFLKADQIVDLPMVKRNLTYLQRMPELNGK